jgi:hypothetical protein
MTAIESTGERVMRSIDPGNDLTLNRVDSKIGRDMDYSGASEENP